MGFLSSALAAKNTYQASPMKLSQYNYNPLMDQSQQQALAGYDVANQQGGRQTQLADMLLAQAQGQGPSLAQMQLQQAGDRASQQQAGLIGSQRGMNPALAQRLVAQNQAGIGQGLAGQSAQLRLQEQQGAQQQLAQALQAQRGQDINQQQASTNLFGTGGQLANQQQENQLTNYWNAQKINSGVAEANQQGQNQITGSFINAAGGVAGAAIGAYDGGMINAQSGGHIPGRANIEGDNPSNDTVPAMLSPGEIVVPRSKADDPEKAKEFIDHLMKNKKKKKKVSYNDVLESHRALDQRISSLEKGK